MQEPPPIHARATKKDRRPVPSPSSEPDAQGVLTRRMWVAMGVAGLLHGGFLLWAYLAPPPKPPSQRRVINMEVVRRKPPEKKPEEQPKEVKPEPPAPKEPTVEQRPSRPLPSLLRPVAPATPEDKSNAVVLPPQPEPDPKDKQPTGPAKGPIDLFGKGSLSTALGLGGHGPAGIAPKGPDRLLKDERLTEKKEEEFHLTPERGGGFRYDGQNFTAHIAPDGALKFEDRSPIGFQKGQTGFSMDITDLMMRGAKQDPYAAQKRRFREYSEKIRQDLRTKHRQEGLEGSLAALPKDLAEIWRSDKPASARRRDLYEYWLHCADDKDGADSKGQRARRQVEEFVRRNLPKDSEDQFTEEELRRFAASRGGLAVFDPYKDRN